MSDVHTRIQGPELIVTIWQVASNKCYLLKFDSNYGKSVDYYVWNIQE